MYTNTHQKNPFQRKSNQLNDNIKLNKNKKFCSKTLFFKVHLNFKIISKAPPHFFKTFDSAVICV